MNILGVDPGLATCGWSIVDRKTAQVVALGVILSERAAHRDESTDRAMRIRAQSVELGAIAARHAVTAIAAEAMSFGGSPKARFRMAISLGLSWGSLAALSGALGVELLEVPPKTWQHAIVPQTKRRVNYDVVFRQLRTFVQQQCPADLVVIRKSDQNHALDATGVALFAALRPRETVRVWAGPPRAEAAA